jgi:hypothetical protein
MGEEKRSREDRKSFRCAAVGARQCCELKVGLQVTPAKLVDESAGGFSVLACLPTVVTVNQTLQIHTNGGWFNVRVIHVQEVLLREEPDVETAEQGPWFRLGLRRLGEVAMPDPAALSQPTGHLRFGLGLWRVPNGLPVMLGLLLAVVAIALPLGLMSIGWNAGLSKAMGLLKWGDSLAEPVEPSESLPSAPQPDSTRQPTEASPSFSGSNDSGRSRSAFNGSAARPSSGRSQPSGASFASAQELKDFLHRLPGAAALALPEVVQQLQLTADQQEQVRQLVEATSQAMRSLGESQQRQQVSQQRTQLLDQARREAIAILTTPQRAKWEKLTGQK